MHIKANEMNKVFLIIFLTCCFFKLTAQVQQKLDFIHKNYAIEQGLPENNVLAITEDNLGFLWIATPNFLCRFDGADFKVFPKSFDYSLNPSSVQMGKLYVQNNKLWMITKGGKLEYMNLETELFYHIDQFNNRNQPIPPLKTLYFDAHQVFLGTEQEGLFITDRDFNLLNHYHTKSHQALSANTINQIFKEKDGNLWILTDKGINRLDTGILTVFEADKSFTDGFEQRNIRLLFSTWQEGTWVKPKTFDRFYFSHDYYPRYADLMRGLRINKIFNYEIYAGYRYATWLATFGGGLKVMDSRDHNVLDVALVNNPREINFIYGSPNGKIWVGSRRNGLYVIDPSLALTWVQSPEEKRFEGIFPLQTQKPDKMFLMTEMGELFGLNAEFNLKEMEGFSQILPDSIFKQKGQIIPILGSESVLLSHKTSDIYLVSPLSGHYEHSTVHLPEQIKEAIFKASDVQIFQDSKNKNHLFFGTEKGLFLSDLKHNKTKELSSLAVEKLLLMDQNKLLALFKNGRIGAVNLITQEFEQHEFLKSAFPSQVEITSAKVQNDWLWIGTLGNGLYLINLLNGAKIHFSKDQGLPNDFIMGMEFSDTRTLWCSTNNGLFKLNFSKSENIIQIENTLYLNYKNGLPVNAFNPDMSFHFRETNICFGADQGILCLESQHPYWESYQSELLITAIKANGQEIHSEKGTHFLESLELEYYQNSLEFYFTSLSRNVPENLNYSYKLVGYDEDWVIAGDRRYASYTNLDPGDYLFQVKLTNENYVGAPLKAVSIQVKQAFWQSIWFKLLVGFWVLGIIYLLYRLRLNYILTVERVKEEISADLHDDLGARLTTIQLLSAIHKQKFKDHPEVKKLLSNIDQEIHNSSEALHELVGNIKMKEDDLEGYFSKLRRYASETLDQANLHYQITIPENIKHVRLSVKKRKDIYFILKELINNIRKHAQANRVEIRMDNKENRLIMSVVDNGVGFNPQHNSHRNGIKNLKARVEKYGGTFELHTKKGEGTNIHITIPHDQITLIKNMWSKGLQQAGRIWIFN